MKIIHTCPPFRKQPLAVPAECGQRLGLWPVLGWPSHSYGLGYHFQFPSVSVLGLALGRGLPLSSSLVCPKASSCSFQLDGLPGHQAGLWSWPCHLSIQRHSGFLSAQAQVHFCTHLFSSSPRDRVSSLTETCVLISPGTLASCVVSLVHA